MVEALHCHPYTLEHYTVGGGNQDLGERVVGASPGWGCGQHPRLKFKLRIYPKDSTPLHPVFNRAR